MTKCRQIENELSAYIDGELTEAARAGVQAHLGACAHCQQRLAELRRLGEGMAQLPQLEPPPRFVTDVRRKIRGEGEEKSWVDVVFRPMWLKLPVEAVALLVLAVGIMFAVRPPAKPAKETALYTAAIETPTAPAETNPTDARKRTDALAKLDEPTALKQMASVTAATPAPAPVGAMSPMPTKSREELLDRATPAPMPGLPSGNAKPANRMLALKGEVAADKASGPEAVVVANVNPTLVEQRVTALVKELQGTLVEVKRDSGAARSIRVRVPTAMVAEFKAQLAEANANAARRSRLQPAFGGGYAAQEEQGKVREDAKKAKEMPMTELEIRITAPAKK